MAVRLAQFMIWGIFQISQRFENVGLDKGSPEQMLAKWKVSRKINLGDAVSTSGFGEDLLSRAPAG